MKIRLHGNSLRLRLTRSEVQALARGQCVRDQTLFSAGAGIATCVQPAGIAMPAVRWDGAHLTVLLPAEEVRQWAASDQVGLGCRQRLDGEQSLEILVEKDFKCLHSPDRQEADAFENPRASS